MGLSRNKSDPSSASALERTHSNVTRIGVNTSDSSTTDNKNEKKQQVPLSQKKPEPTQNSLEISDLIGHWGKYQMQIFLFKITIGITSAFNNLGITFSAPQEFVTYKCAQEQQDVINSTISIDAAHQCRFPNNTKCTEWIYDTGLWRSTMIDEWNLVCDRSWLISASQSTYMFSFILAYLIFGPLSDRYGRFHGLLLGASLEVLAGLGCAMSTSVTQFIICRFFLGFGCAGRSSSSYLIMIEWVGQKYRMQVSTLGSMGWIIGYCSMPWCALYFAHFRHLQFAVCAFEFIVIGWLLLLMPESPRWLLTHNKFDEARRVLLRAAKINGYRLDNFSTTFEQIKLEIEAKKFAKNEHKLTIIDLMRWTNLRRYTLALFLVWSFNTFIYYGIALRMSEFGTNLFVDFTIAGFTELPAMLFSILCMKLLPRRGTNISIFLVTGILCALMSPLMYYGFEAALTSLAMINKMLVSMAFTSVLYQTIEIYPTTVRQTASSSCQLAGRIGSTLAPFIKEFASVTHELVPPLIYAGMALLSSWAIVILPETKGIELPDTMEEADNVEAIRRRRLRHQSSSSNAGTTTVLVALNDNNNNNINANDDKHPNDALANFSNSLKLNLSLDPKVLYSNKSSE